MKFGSLDIDKMFLGDRDKEQVLEAIKELHNDAVLTALSVLTKVTRDDVLFQHYLDSVLETKELPEGATPDDLREMMEREVQILHALYHNEIHEMKEEQCESSESTSESTSLMRDYSSNPRAVEILSNSTRIRPGNCSYSLK